MKRLRWDCQELRLPSLVCAGFLDHVTWISFCRLLNVRLISADIISTVCSDLLALFCSDTCILTTVLLWTLFSPSTCERNNLLGRNFG